VYLLISLSGFYPRIMTEKVYGKEASINRGRFRVDRGGGGMNELYEVITWLIYVLAGIVMLVAIVSAVLVGLVLRLVAEFLRGFTEEDG
jgi:hypothetical protein